MTSSIAIGLLAIQAVALAHGCAADVRTMLASLSWEFEPEFSKPMPMPTTVREGLLQLWREHCADQDPRSQKCGPPIGMIAFVGGEWEAGEDWCINKATTYLWSECYERPINGRRGGATGSWYLCDDCVVLIAMWLEDSYAGEVILKQAPWPLPELLDPVERSEEASQAVAHEDDHCEGSNEAGDGVRDRDAVDRRPVRRVRRRAPRGVLWRVALPGAGQRGDEGDA